MASSEPSAGRTERRSIARGGRGDAGRPQGRPVPQQAEQDEQRRRTTAPVHLTAQAAPNRTPASKRHGRGPRLGTPLDRSAPSAISIASRARILSRSTTSAPKPATTKNCRKMSSSAVRESTTDRPSRASSRPAIAPKRFERNIRRAVRVRMTTREGAGERRRDPPADRSVLPQQRRRDHRSATCPAADGR